MGSLAVSVLFFQQGLEETPTAVVAASVAEQFDPWL
jgi:hypothetical protein